jgi:hypothetical protein
MNPQRKKGDPPLGGKVGGRPKGSRERPRATMKGLNQVAMEQARKTALTPLEFMLQILGNPKNSFAKRAWAAQTAAPYIHKRMPIAIEGGDPTRPIMIAAADQLKTLSAEEFALLTLLSAKIKGALPSPEDFMKAIHEQAMKDITPDEEPPP